MEFTLDGKRIHTGTGGRTHEPGLPWVVLLHGAGMDHTVFALQARALAHHRRNVLALDLAGHGGSEGPALDSIGALADWVLRATDACGIARFRLGGHSMGALIALEAAARAPERLEALALIGFAPEMRVHPDLLAAARGGEHQAVELMTSWSLAMPSQLGGNPAPGLWFTGAALRLLERADLQSLAADLAACDAYRGAPQAAARVRCPVQLLVGADDRMTPARRAQSFAGQFGECQVRLVPGVGHLLMIEAPGPTLEVLRTVL